MFINRILSLFYLLLHNFSADAFFRRPSLAFHGVAFNHLLATTPAPQGGDDKNDTCADFPPLYDEADEMVKVALLTYAYATLRKCAAKKPDVYVGEEAILSDDSVSSQEIYGFVNDNIDILKNEKDFKGEDGDFAFKQLQALLNLNKYEDLKDDSEITIFKDKYARQLCYGIGLNKVKKWIVVSFRGTSSTFDIVDDVKVAGADAENPLYKETPNQKRTMQIHKGFYNALFKDKENGVTKFDLIMNQILQLKKENPEFKVYVTGHSLGGALATLFAFYASTSNRWGDLSPFPVTCVSVASPLVGDYNWRCAFMLQEKLGKIRHLRISNYGDVVPKVPCFGLDIPPFTYKHVGIHLQLYDDKPPRLSFPANGDTPKIDTDENVITPITPSQILYFHGCDLYVDRLNKGRETLEGKNLNGLYADPAFVGEYNNV